MKNWLPIAISVSLACLPADARAADIRNAARNGDLAAVRALLEKNPALVNEPDKRNCIPLHFASGEGQTAVMALLLAKGADIKAIDADGDTPLHWAAISGKDEAVRVLLDHDAEINARNYHDETPLLYAAKALRYSTVTLLARSGADLELANDYGRTPLLWVCREGGNLQMARQLLRLGANPNALDRFNDSPLCLAAWRGFHQLVGILLDAGARTNIREGMLAELLGYATKRGGDRLYEQVVRDGVDIDVAPGSFGKSVLHDAAAGGSARIVKDLLERGASPSQKDLYGWTPLHYAASRGRPEATRALAEEGAPLDARTISGWSALNLAEKKGADKVARFLRDRGASEEARRFPRLRTPLLGQGDASAEPAPFAPDIVATCHGEHGTVTFSPDGREIYWSGSTETPDSGYGFSTILYSRFVEGQWTPPARASFAGDRGFDVPFFAPDGRRLYFISRQPLAKGQPGGKENIWYVDRKGEGWGEPRPLPPAVNRMQHHWQFSVAANGNLYFNSRRGPEETAGVYVSRLVGGEHGEPEFLGFKGGMPLIAPDESWLITFEFMKNNRRSNVLRIRKPDGNWGEPIDLSGIIPGGGGVCPKLSPDGRAFFYISQVTGANNNFWVDAGWLDELLRRHKPH